jgi:hypothetical protein
MTHYRQALCLAFLPCLPACDSWVANYKTERHTCIPEPKASTTWDCKESNNEKKTKSQKGIKIQGLPNGCVKHLQQKLTAEMDGIFLQLQHHSCLLPTCKTINSPVS